MRVKHILWKVNNGWMMVPEDSINGITPSDAAEIYIFKTLKEFADWKPKRVRRRKATKAEPPPQHTKD